MSRASATPLKTGTALHLGAFAVAGGIWGALLARVIGELWPTWCAQAIPLWAVLVLGSSAGVPLLVHTTGRAQGDPCASYCAWPMCLGLVYLVQPNVSPLWGAALLVAGLGGTFWLCAETDSASRTEWLWNVLVLVGAFALYLSTLAPSVLPGDSGEFQTVAPTLGVPHPTGYPLYLVLGKLFSLLPVGSAAYRLNLLSACAAAGAVWAVYRAGRALGLRRVSSLFGAALLAASETLWSQGTIAEKYALHAFFVALTLYLGLRWRAARLAGQDGNGWLMMWALCYGLSLTHHRTMLLFAPVYLALVWLTDRRALRWRSVWRPLLPAVAPLALYLLLPLFSALDPPYAYVRIDSVRAFLDLVLARTYQSGLLRGGWSAVPGRLVQFSELTARQFSLLGLALALAGWVSLLWRQRAIAWVLLGGIVLQAVFALNYYVANTPVYYLPAYVWLAVPAAAAVDAVLSAIAGARTSAPLRRHLALAWLLAVTVLPVGLVAARWRGMDQRRSYAHLAFDYSYGQLALRSVEDDALIIGDWMPATVLWYTQHVEGLSPGVQVASVDSLEWQWESLAETALHEGRPVYLARPLVASGERYALSSAGPLVRLLSTSPTTAPAMAVSQDTDLAGEIRLLGYDWLVTGPDPEDVPRLLQDGELASGSTLNVTLYWQALREPQADYAITVRLVDAEGRTRAERRARHPVRGTYPFSRWQPRAIVADAHALDLPPHLASGEYQVVVTVGLPFSGTGLVDASGSDQVVLGSVQVQKPLRWPRAALSVPIRERLGDDLVLMGYDGPKEISPGEIVPVVLQYLVTGEWNGQYPKLAVASDDGDQVTVPSLLNAAEDWQRGALVALEYTLTVPENAQQLQVTRARPDGRAWTRMLPVRVVDAPPPIADFGGQIRLRDYAYASRSLGPGGTVRLVLDWEAAVDIGEAYKVFVHVLGPNGLPIAQQDNEPVNNTYPTTRWRRGERISDLYAFALPEGLPPGEYAVEVGLYRISDLSRLPLLNEEQNMLDDKVFLEPVIVE